MLQSAQQGQIDVITAITRTPAREQSLLFTEPYIDFPIVVFSRKQAPLVTGLSDLPDAGVAVVEGYAAHEFLSAGDPDLTPVLFANVEEAVNALALGEVDWFVNDLATGSYTIEKHGIMNLKVAATTGYTLSLAMAVPKEKPELVAILNQVLDVVSDERAAEFKGTWLALKFEHGLDMRTVLAWALPTAGVALLIIVVVVLWNRQLGSEIREREKAQAALAETMLTLNQKNQMLEGLSAKLSKYLSPQVYASIFSGSRDVTLSTERKKLTVFFSDIMDFTQTTDDMQPEDLTALLNSYFTEMSEIAMEFGATVDKFVGDAMLLFFGDPETQGVKKDAELCVRMALAMQGRMAELEQEWQAMGYDKPFKIRVGINTGYCNVGNFGSESRMDYTIIGGEVNLAARLEARADPGGVLISSETHALVKDIVNAEERESISVKEIRRQIQPYAVLSLRDADEAAAGGRDRRIRIQEHGFDLAVDLDALPASKHGVISSQLIDIARRLQGN